MTSLNSKQKNIENNKKQNGKKINLGKDLKKENGKIILNGTQKIKLDEKNLFVVNPKKTEDFFQINNNKSIDLFLTKIKKKKNIPVNITQSKIQN